ncbi:uncharacterized protein LOC121369949 [Gigantopelta aegis]|uniref:uncharacterized protein LOC121369949 n=1 Tax=Gigantopelta aegis TaxID=1735272 RepID=UPI001B88A30C|nr:uncharacterized protein LOC121369949 [Gigantopelta aegis]
MYYSENTSNQIIWIELTGSKDIQMNLSCSSWIYSATMNTSYKPQPSQTGTPVTPSSTYSMNITETLTANYNTIFTTAFANTTATVIKSSQTPTSSVPTSVENTTPTEVTTNDSETYSSGQSSSRENDQQTIVISVVVVAVALFVSAVVAAVAIVYRKRRRNALKSRDNVTSKRNSNVYSDTDDGAVNNCYSKDDVIQSPNRDQIKTNVQVVVIANDLPASKLDNTPQKSNRPPINPRKSRAAFSNKEAENEGSGDISSELGEHPVFQTNSNDIDTKVNAKHVTTPESSSKCVPEEEMKDNFYSMDFIAWIISFIAWMIRNFKILKSEEEINFHRLLSNSQICVPEEEMKDNFLYSMDDTEFQDSQICVPEEEMKDNFLYSMDDTEFQDSQKCVPEEEMKDNFLYSMDDTEFQDSQICVPEEEMKDNFLYSMDDTKF